MANNTPQESIRRHLPKGRSLPAGFDDFVRVVPAAAVQWNDLDAYSLKPSARREAVPFFRLPDGGLVALWYHGSSPAVVHIGGHGELQVLATDFDNFLKGLAARCSGLPDFDEGEESVRIPGIRGKPDVSGLPEFQRQFDEWFQQHTSLLTPDSTPEAEALRQRVFAIAERMLGDGLCRVYTQSSSWWSMRYRIEREQEELRITYLDYGEWYEVPAKYHLGEEVQSLLRLAKSKRLTRYELEVCSPGIVSVDNDRQLVLVPPGFEPTQV
jgi:hypothetical protein